MSAPRLRLFAPILVLIVAATAVPIQLRPRGAASFSFSFGDVPDMIANVAGFVPLGIVLAAFGVRRATLLAAGLSIAVETAQIAMMHRDPSLVDVLTNVAGGALGAWLASGAVPRWQSMPIGRRTGAAAAILACVPFFYLDVDAPRPVNARGIMQPGRLEGAWALDTVTDRSVDDASGHGLDGRFRREPEHVTFPRGTASIFERGNYVNLGRSTALRLEGSMTVTGWISPHAWPEDDAAIVSARRELGFQLDTTIDRGPRTLSLKLSDPCGRLMARYGSTALRLDTWYHVAGAYDAVSQQIHVYVDGRTDDGDLVGTVSRVQRSSRGGVYIGRRANSTDFNFTGALADVRVYSFPLTRDQVVQDMKGEPVEAPASVPSPRGPAVQREPCGAITEREDKDLPFAAALTGAFVALAAIGLSGGRLRAIAPILSAGAGAIALTTAGSSLPSFNLWTIPLTAFAAGLSIALSVRRPAVSAVRAP